MAYDPEAEGAHCSSCPLGGKERQFVPPAPPASGKVKLVIVGEGPGRTELFKGQPFVGQSGRLLDTLFAEAGSKDWRKDAFITNSTLCRSTTDLELEEATACCAPRLLKELQALPKKAPIVTLGKPATKVILGVNGIMRARGFVWKTREIADNVVKAAKRAAEKEVGEKVPLQLRAEALELRAKLSGRTVLPSIHPAFVLRSEIWRPVLGVDLDRVVRLLKAGGRLPLVDQDGEYRVVTKKKDVEKALASLGPEISHDIETDDKDPIIAQIRCVGVSDGEKTFVIFPWVSKVHTPLLNKCFKKRTVIGHNSFAYDSIAEAREGVVYPKKEEDTLIAHHSFASHLPQGLAFVASVFADCSPWKITFKHGAAGAEKGIPPSKLPPEDLCRYNAADCRITIQVWKAIQADLEPEMHTYLHDKRLAAMCRSMQVIGIPVDQKHREYLSRALQRRANRFLRRMRALTGKKSFNPYATADLRYAFYEKFKAPVLVITEKTGTPSTAATVLQQFAQSNTRYGKLARYVLKFRGARGTRQRNIEGVYVHRDGRVHASWKSFGTMNGRLSCKMQQLPKMANPKRPILEDRIREIYVAGKGKVFVYFDLSQAEMRYAAHLSGDKNFIRICSEKDVHSMNACLIFPEAKKYILEDKAGKGKAFRDIAKNVGFAINYGAGEVTLYQRLQAQSKKPVSMKVVRQVLSVLHKEFRDHFKYVDRNFKDVEQCGYMRSPLLGRIRWFGWKPSLQEVMNTPVQQVVADYINQRMFEMEDRMAAEPKKFGKCQLVFQGHDAALYLCDEGAAEENMVGLIKEVMERPVELKNGLSFVVPIDLKKGQRMSDVA
jgi:uracil-DNA glycosylase family 4